MSLYGYPNQVKDLILKFIFFIHKGRIITNEFL